jgi:peptide/nickel transport system permease protein
MSTYIVRRVFLSIPALLGVTVVIFVALRVMPGDPVSVMFGTQATKIRPEDRAKIEADLGLSSPLIVQYGKWLHDIASGKLGRSFWRGDTVVDLIVQRGPLTVEIAVMAIVLSWMVGVPVGILPPSGRTRCWTMSPGSSPCFSRQSPIFGWGDDGAGPALMARLCSTPGGHQSLG